MYEMLGLLGGHKPCLRFESLFLKSMPEDARLQLATASFDDPQPSRRPPMHCGKKADSHPRCLQQTTALHQLQSSALHETRDRERPTERPTSVCTTGDSATRPGSATHPVRHGKRRSRSSVVASAAEKPTACCLSSTITQPSVTWLTREHLSGCFMPRTSTDTVVYARLPLSLPTGSASLHTEPERDVSYSRQVQLHVAYHHP